MYVTQSMSFVKFKRFLEKYTNFNGWNEHNEVGICTLIKLSKEFDSIMYSEYTCKVTRNYVGVLRHISNTYVDDI